MGRVALHLYSRRAAARALAAHPGATVLDLTSRGPSPWVRFSPFWPHGGIPVPFTPGASAASVEGIWQGLKVFERADIDPGKLQVTSMRGLKRTVARFGRVLGHREGLHGERLLPYAEARRQIYLPSYLWTLEHRLQTELASLRALAAGGDVVLLDYETNADLDDLSRPLSHAALVIRRVLGTWP